MLSSLPSLLGGYNPFYPMLMTNSYFSTLATRSCTCKTVEGPIVEYPDGNTHTCCDIWERRNTPGVHYSGSWARLVCTSFICKPYYYTTINLSGSVMITKIKLTRLLGSIAALLRGQLLVHARRRSMIVCHSVKVPNSCR